MLDFSHQRVVITGAAGGVGRALVKAFGSLRAEIIAYDRDEAALAELDVAEAVAFDLQDRTALKAAVAATLEGKPAPAAVICNAGLTRAETLGDIDDAKFDSELNLNLTAVADLSRAFLPAMRNRDGGAAFVFISSVNALVHFGNPAYAAAKAGTLAWMRALAAEEGCNHIRANAIAPGSIRTAAWDHRFERFEGLEERVSRLYPLRRMVQPHEVANAAVFLASPLASGITGVTLNVDAGLLASNLPFLQEIAPETT
jgi:NAD(P)-dependent dehydrogenase (short-subunit alcohol dehydrogenase family)